MAGCALHLLVTLLAFSYLVRFNAVATSRTLHLLYESREISAFKDVNQKSPAEIPELEDEKIERNDYPVSGANERHTPRPPATSEGGKS